MYAAPPTYAREVRPFFARWCMECHSGAEPQGGLNLENFKGLMAGGDHGPVLAPGKADASRIVRMVEGKARPAMPPRRARQPPAAEIALLRAWIDAGAREDGAGTEVVVPDVRPRHPVAPPVTALAYHPDGKLLAAGGRKEVSLFDSATGALKGRIDGLLPRVTALAFRPDGGALAVAVSNSGGPHEVRLYEFGPSGPGKAVVLGAPDDVTYALAFRPDGKLLASAGYDRLIRLWDTGPAPRKPPRLLKDHSDAVYGLAFSPDGALLASAAADRAVKVWDIATDRRLYTLGESTDWVYDVAWSPDGRHLGAAGVDRSVRVWEVGAGSGRVVHSVFAHEAPVSRLVYSADGKTLYSIAEDGGAKAWDARRMVERTVYPVQPDTPLSFAVRPDGKQLAIGRFDGALVLLDEATGKAQAQPLPLKPRPPVLGTMVPNVVSRGQATVVTLQGEHLEEDLSLVTSLAGVRWEPIPGGVATRRQFRLTVPATASAGLYPVQVQTAGGKSAAVNLTVDLFRTNDEVEPNDSPRTAQAVILPASVAGAIGRAGDVDYFAFDAATRQEIGAQALTSTVGSKLELVLQLVDPDGRVIAESTSGLLGGTCPRAGRYAVGIRDRDYRGGAAMHYRLHIGPVAVVTGIFPPGARAGQETDVRLEGVHLGDKRSVKVKIPADAAPGSRAPVPIPTGALGSPAVAVGKFAETLEGPDMTIPVPGTANGRIDRPGAAQTWHFHASKGEQLIVEVQSRRLGSPLDSVIELFDSHARPVPVATLRCQARTYVTFRDHDSTGSGIRIESWSALAINDWVLVGQELLRIHTLPRNPDDDCQFYSDRGQRLGWLGTTPTHHPMGEPMYKVSLHPPGTTFPPNGLPVVTLNYRNDDGGPGMGKDSRLVFDPPADGDYQLRITDARGQGGALFAYRLTVRPPAPSFKVQFSPTAPTVSRGSAVPIAVTAERIDGFEDAICVRLENLPAGLSAPATAVPAGENSTSFALFADSSTTIPGGAPPLKLVATAKVQGKVVVQEVPGAAPKVIDPARS